jgi:hypothetical protein
MWFFRSSTLNVFIASFALAITANAQLGRKTVQPPAPAPQQEAAPVPPPAAAPARPAPPKAAQERPAPKTESKKAQPAPEQEGPESSDAGTSTWTEGDSWHIGLLAFSLIIAVVAFLLWLRSRHIVNCDQIEAMIHDIVSPEVKNAADANRKLIANLADAAGIPMDQVDPEGARAQKVAELQNRIQFLERQQADATKAKQFTAAGKLEDELDGLRRELDSLQQPREDHDRTTRRVPRSPLSLLLTCFAIVTAAHSAHAATCYNTETGKTPGTVKVAIAVVNSANTFGCAVAGSKVELVDADNPGTVVLTPTITKKSPLTFGFTPTSEGRLIVKVDGRLFNQLAIRSQAIAEGINDAADLIGGSSGGSAGVDAKVRMVLEGAACGASPDPACVAKFRAEAWGNTKGSSSKAGANVRNAFIESVYKDDRYVALKARADSAQAQADAAKAAADAAQAKADSASSNTGGVTEARVGEIVDGKIDSKIAPLTTSIQAAQAAGDEAKIDAGHAKQVAVANATVTTALLDLDAKGKKLPKATATEWEKKLEEACKAAGVPCAAPVPAPKADKPAKKAPLNKKPGPKDQFGQDVKK